jgi:hypothetical protein
MLEPDRVKQGRDMHVDDIKARVRGDNYVVDPHEVAAALLRRGVGLGALSGLCGPGVPASRRGARDRAAPAPPRHRGS